MRLALKQISSGDPHEPRHVLNLMNGNALGFMGAEVFSKKILGYKIVSVFPRNGVCGLNPHQGIVVLLDEKTGQVKSIQDGLAITALRTAAVSAVATEILSRPESKILTLIGDGRQAYEHLRALLRVRDFKTVKIYARSEKRFDFFRSRFGTQLDIHFFDSSKKALQETDVVVTCTSSAEAVVDSRDFPEGCHVNAVGSCRPGQQEVNISFNPGLKIFLDHLGSSRLEADEIFRPRSKAPLNLLIQSEIGECIGRAQKGRQSKNEITFFKSVGLAIEDVFTADLVYQKAIRSQMVQEVQIHA